jgi:NitT/TauT family transport system permease protein
MTAAASTVPEAGVPRGPNVLKRFLRSHFVAVVVVVAAILVAWYVGAFFLNAPFQRDLDKTAARTPEFVEFVKETWSQERPVLPAPHQVAEELYKSVLTLPPNSKKSLVYHGWITLSSTLVGFIMGTLLGIALAVAIVHAQSLDRSLMPWIVSSQTIPILAIAPMIVVVTYNWLTGQFGVPSDISRFLAKAFISTYLSFFPVTVGMVKGLRSPDPTHLDLMRTYSASGAQTFWKLRWPAAVPFLFVSMKVAIAASLVGAVVGELPTGAVAGLGARLLTGSYYGQTVQIWAALVAASLMAAVLVAIVGIANRIVLGRMGMKPG